MCSRREVQGVLIDLLETCKDMRQKALALFLSLEPHIWKGSIDQVDGALGPPRPGKLVHAILDHDLHQTMDGEAFGVLEPSYQRERQEHDNRLVEEESVFYHRLKRRAQFRSSSRKKVFRNTIRAQKCAQPQEIS